MVDVINSRCNAEKRLSATYLNIMGLKGFRLTTTHATSTTVPDCCCVCVCFVAYDTAAGSPGSRCCSWRTEGRTHKHGRVERVHHSDHDRTGLRRRSRSRKQLHYALGPQCRSLPVPSLELLG